MREHQPVWKSSWKQREAVFWHILVFQATSWVSISAGPFLAVLFDQICPGGHCILPVQVARSNSAGSLRSDNPAAQQCGCSISSSAGSLVTFGSGLGAQFLIGQCESVQIPLFFGASLVVWVPAQPETSILQVEQFCPVCVSNLPLECLPLPLQLDPWQNCIDRPRVITLAVQFVQCELQIWSLL